MGIRIGVGIGLLFAVSFVAAGCSTDPAHAEEETEAAAVPAAAGVAKAPASRPGPTSTESYGSVTELTQAVDGKLRKVRGLTREERAQLRRDVNAIQIERARRLGIAPGSAIEPLISAGRLVRVDEATGHWIVRDLKYSEPYVTPSTLAMLTEIGERFHAQLDSLGVPRYRLDITSVLRTSDKQAALRRANSNASKIESAHEFGTTVDIAYRRFKAPAEEIAVPTDPFLRDSLLEATANLRSGELQAVLGRVLAEMQSENKVLVRMERRQTVYHITVGR